MENQKQVVHFEGKAGFTTAQSNEHLRNWTEKGWASANANGRIDRSRQHLNFEITKGGRVQPINRSRSIPQLFAARLKELGIKDPNEGRNVQNIRTMADFIISGTHETLHRLAFGDQEVRFDFADANELVPDPERNGVNAELVRRPEIELWAKDMYDTLCGKFGEDNVLSFVVHCDERTPHVHAVVVPVIDGRLSYKQIFCGADKYEFRQRTLALHDLFAEVNRKWGLGRGDSVAETHRKHRSTEEYRRELSGQCSALENEVEEKYATLSDLNRQIRLAETRIKGLQTMVRNLEQSRDAVEHELSEVHRMLSSDAGDPQQRQALVRQEESWQKQLDAILTKLEDKRSKLLSADEKLAGLQEQLVEAHSRHDELLAQIRDANGNVSQLMVNRVGSEALWSVLNDFRRLLPALPPTQQAVFDDSLVQEMVQRGMGIVVCAALLSMNLIDNATDYAETHGGGGGHADGNWGRNPDEDERQWLRRCLAQSRKLMRPASRKVKR